MSGTRAAGCLFVIAALLMALAWLQAVRLSRTEAAPMAAPGIGRDSSGELTSGLATEPSTATRWLTQARGEP
ncbi:MAG TPA: hypothetical protein VEI97_14580 [bacterium]|nr:hypothetical protein [bacterium]